MLQKLNDLIFEIIAIHNSSSKFALTLYAK